MDLMIQIGLKTCLAFLNCRSQQLNNHCSSYARPKKHIFFSHYVELTSHSYLSSMLTLFLVSFSNANEAMFISH
jgi:hypothetical protein